MKSISLKVPDEVFEKIETYRKLENMNRSSYVMEAVVSYSKNLEREQLREQLKKESIMDKELYEEEIKEWDHMSNEGLETLNDDWN